MNTEKNQKSRFRLRLILPILFFIIASTVICQSTIIKQELDDRTDVDVYHEAEFYSDGFTVKYFLVNCLNEIITSGYTLKIEKYTEKPNRKLRIVLSRLKILTGNRIAYINVNKSSDPSSDKTHVEVEYKYHEDDYGKETIFKYHSHLAKEISHEHCPDVQEKHFRSHKIIDPR